MAFLFIVLPTHVIYFIFMSVCITKRFLIDQCCLASPFIVNAVHLNVENMRKSIFISCTEAINDCCRISFRKRHVCVFYVISDRLHLNGAPRMSHWIATGSQHVISESCNSQWSYAATMTSNNYHCKSTSWSRWIRVSSSLDIYRVSRLFLSSKCNLVRIVRLNLSTRTKYTSLMRFYLVVMNKNGYI